MRFITSLGVALRGISALAVVLQLRLLAGRVAKKLEAYSSKSAVTLQKTSTKVKVVIKITTPVTGYTEKKILEQ